MPCHAGARTCSGAEHWVHVRAAAKIGFGEGEGHRAPAAISGRPLPVWFLVFEQQTGKDSFEGLCCRGKSDAQGSCATSSHARHSHPWHNAAAQAARQAGRHAAGSAAVRAAPAGVPGSGPADRYLYSAARLFLFLRSVSRMYVPMN